jgi:hypothetical protein
MRHSTPVRSRRRRWRPSAVVAVVVVAPLALLALTVLPSEAAGTPGAGGVYTFVPGASGNASRCPAAPPTTACC